MNPLQSLFDYEHFIYTLPQTYPLIHRSTLSVVRRGRGMATLRGQVEIGIYHLRVAEKISFAKGYGVIMEYGYEVWRGGKKLYWYDPQPHPHIPELAENHPHHKHIPPDIKHNRIPALALTFTQPNLPFLIAEIIALEEHST